MVKSTNISDGDYFEKVVKPFFSGALSKGLSFTVTDLEGRILLISDSCVKDFGYKNMEEIIGKKLELCSLEEEPLITQIEAIRNTVIKEEKMISFMKMSNFNGSFKTYQLTYMPLFKPDGTIFAILSSGKQARYLMPREYFDHICTTKLKSLARKMNLNIKLTDRQHQILYLLIYGLTQEEIAKVLKITRTTVATVIARVSDKFGIAGSATKILVQMAIAIGLYKKIPSSLLNPRIIIIDDGEFL